MEQVFLSETAKRKCRVCKKKILSKNYKAHLKAVHVGENHEDLTPLGQSKISDLLKKKNADEDKDRQGVG